MAHNQALKACLDAILTDGTEILQQSHTNGATGAQGANGPHNHVASGHDPRKRLVDAATRLIQLAMEPEEYLDHLANSYQELSCVRWLVELNVLRHLPLDGSSIDYSTLSKKAGVPEGQLKSVSRMAVVNGFLEESRSSREVSHSHFSTLLVRDESFMSWAQWMLNYSMPVAYKFADATRTWGDTEAKNEVAFNLALDTKDLFFDYLKKTPDLTSLFSGYMRSVTASRPWSLHHAVESFDWASLPKGAKIVDVGGSHGQLCVQVANEFPDLNFIIQDLPEAVETAQKSFTADENIKSTVKSRIQFMSHDFFTPQPVVDAQIYFLRMIIHDWPDKDALLILKHLADVLKQNPSARIVIMDTVLPQPGTTTVLHEQRLRLRDLMMRQVFNSKEREMEEWEALLHKAGLQIQQVTLPEDSVMGLLTAKLQEGDQPGKTAYLVKPMLPANGHGDDLPILIIGAGISGLCLAQALKKSNIPFRVFERDVALESRPQGYRLKLQADAAQALSEILPDDIYRDFQTSCAILSVGETDFNPFTGTIIHSRSGGGLSGKLGLNPSFTVDRTAFRKALMRGISEHVFFNKALDSYEYSQDAKNGVSVSFKDGETVHGRFLVGADGLHSAVKRQHLPSYTLRDTGASCIYGKTLLTHDLIRRFPQPGLRWMTVVSDSAPMLQSCLIGDSPVTLLLEPIRFSEASRQAQQQQLPADYLYWALIGPEKRFLLHDGESNGTNGDVPGKGTAVTSSHAARLALAITEEWDPSIRSVLELQDTKQTTLVRVASAIPEIPAWKPSALVALLGDAIHPMSPCGGVGANTAICDAAGLAKVLIAADGSPSTKSIGKFEEEMRKRAYVSIVRSEIGSKKMFGLRSLAECKTWTGT